MEHFILKVPEWNGRIVFDYETVMFVMAIAILLVGLLLCFWGYRYMQTLCIVTLACFTGIVGMQLAQKLTENAIVQMYGWILFTFICTCIFYYLSCRINSLLGKLHIREKLVSKTYLIAALLGATVVSVDVYFAIYCSPLVLVLFIALAVLGILHGKRKKASQRVFYTYEELYQRKTLAGERAVEEHA